MKKWLILLLMVSTASANLSNSIEAHSTKSTDFDLRSFHGLQDLSSGMHLHSANSTVFKLATFFQINNISKSIQNHSANSSNLHIRIFENKPELWSSGRNHIKNSSSYSLRIFEKRSNLSLSTDPHNEKSSLYRLKTFNHIAELNWTRLKNAENSSEFRLRTFRKLSNLSSSAKVKSSNSSMQLIHTDKAFPCSSLNFGIIDSDTELIANLKSNGNCLTTISNNIILNCNNKTISGNRTNYGIYLNNRENVTIKNCNIPDYDYGIYLKDSSKNLIMDNTVYSNMQYDIYLNNSNSNSVINNSACFIYGNKSKNNISNNTCEISLQFENIPENISVKREFQSIRIQVKNSGRYKASFITGKIENISEPSSFIGPGEPVNPIFLNPGEARNLTIGLTLSDAKELRYSPEIKLYFREILMSEAGLNLLLPSWENYRINISQSLWNISLPVKNNTKINNSRIRISQVQEYNSSEICMNSKQRVDITNTGPEPISDLSVETSGDMEFFLTPKISRFKLNPGQSTEFTIYAIINESTGDSNGSIKISGANFTEEIPVFYNKPNISGYWKPAPEFPTDSYLTASVNSFICINNPRYCVNLNIPKDIGMDKIKESSLVMNFEDRCGSAQAHDTYIYLNGNLIESLNSTITIGQFEFPFNKNLLNYSNELCVNTLNYVGSGHFCANTGNTLKLKVSNYRMYCTDLVCIKTENFETNFTDNRDNDCDGFIDWNDLDSCNFGNNNTILCPPKENCTDGIDNDGNGLTDWDDTTICIASCNDTYRNGNETGIDCGGNCAQCKPDLAIGKIGISGNLTEGEIVEINSTILNLNAGDADNAIFRLIAGNFTTNKIFSISGNSNKNMNFNLILTPEMKNLIISLDPENQIRESNETNNNATLSLTITEKLPDLTVTEISFSQENTSKINITAVIKNLGDKDSGLFYVEFLIDNRSEFTQSISNLTPDKNITIIHRTIINPGNHTITVIAESDNKIKESNEFNNELSKSLFIQYPDLTIISLTYTPLNLSEVNFTATVMNLGETTRDFFLTMFYVNDTVLDILGIATQGLASGEKVNITQNWIPRTGVWVIKAVTDWNNMIPESNENNNQLTKQIIISGPCKKSTKISGTIIENEKPLPNAYIDAYLNSVIIGSDKTNPQGKYSLNLDKEKLPAIGSVEVELYPYEITIPISCGEDKKDVDIILSDLGDKEKPVIYTSTNNGKPERVFKSGDKVYITVILKNPTQEKISERLEISITDESGNEIEEIMSKNINLKPNEIKTIDEHWKSRDFAKQNLSGFEFTGRKFFVNVEFGNSIQQYGFYVDEFGVPEWLRNNVELHLGDEFRDVIDKAKSKEEVLEYYRKMMEYAKSAGFSSVLFHHYYSYGYNESHQKSEINYWFPAGSSSDSHYNTPYQNIKKLVGNEEEARNLIKQLVDIAHSKGLKVIAYIDPMAIYSPDETGIRIDPEAIGHYNAETEGFAAMDSSGNPKRANFLETKWLISDINHLAVQISPCGHAKDNRLANNEAGFSPSKISADLNSDWSKDPSHHYQTIKEVNWLINNYGFDGISTDDTGRLIMTGRTDISTIRRECIIAKVGYVDDAWTCLMYPTKPTKSLYGISEDKYCQELRGNQDKDYFAMDSFANMIKHMRRQIKDSNPDRILISNDYFVPKDVNWSSIIASEDVSASDQFNIMKPSFARWAYKTYYDGGYKALRNDLRRTLFTIPKIEIPPIFVEPISYKAMQDRPHLLRGVLLAMSWANKVHSEILLDELKKTNETERLLKSYVDMRKKINLPIYNSEVGQEILYHSNLKDPTGFKSDAELKKCWNDWDISCPNYLYSYDALLYRIPSDYGEKARILHVINSRAATEGIENDEVPMDYSFRIRIPSLEEVQGVYLVSADINPITNKTRYTNYVENITSETDKWYISNNYLHLKLPQVITSTIAYIEFKPKNLTGKSYGSQSIIDKNGKIQRLQSLDLRPVKENETQNQSLPVSPEDNLLSLSLNWGGSDLDLHLYSPSGQHYGYNYTTNTTDGNATYTSTNTTESISVQNPESGNWTIKIYGKNVSQQYNETGEPYSLGISMVGDYKPNLTAGISAKTVTLNESASLPVSIRNIGSATAYNLSAIFYSDSFNITENISLQSLEAGIGLNTEINALPLALGNATVYLNLTYYDSEGNQYKFSNSTVMQVITNPRLYIFLDYSPVNPTTADILRFNISLLNIGSSTAYRINLTTQLDSGISAITPSNFSSANLSSGQSADFSFNATAQEGRFYARSYAYYESQNGSLFLAGSNEVEIKVSETTTTTTSTTTTLPTPPTTIPPEQPTTTTTLLTTTSTTTTITQTTTTITQPITTSTTTTSTITTSTTTSSTTTSLTTTTTLTTTTSSSTTTLLWTITTTTSTITPTTTLPDIIPPEILKSLSKVDGKKALLQILSDEISICKYDAEDTAYEEMQNFFTETNSTVHSEILKLQKGSYTFYARCIDRFGNVDNSSAIFNLTINATSLGEVFTQLPVSKEIILCKNDGIKNYAEEGIDCGGHCKPCETTTTVRTTTTTTLRIATTTLTTVSKTTRTTVTTTTLTKTPDIIGRVIAVSEGKSSEIMLIATILLLTVGLIYYLKKGG